MSFLNPNSPSGFTPVKHAFGGTIRPSYYTITGGLASNIYRGSLVKPAGVTNGKNIDVVAAGNNPSIGVFKGVSYVDAGGNTQFRPYWGSGQTILTGSTPEAYVFDDPEILFDAQVSGTNGLAATNIGNTANVVIGTGSQVTGQSADQVDGTTFSASSTTQQLQVVELRELVNNTYGQFARALISIFLHYKGPVAGGGVVF